MGFGKNLELSLKEHNISVAELSRRTNISVQTLYSIIRRDSNRVNMDLLRKIEDAIGDPEYSLSTAQMDFDGILYEQIERYLPHGYTLKQQCGELRLQYPDDQISRETDYVELRGIIDKVTDYMKYELEKLRKD